MFGQTNVDVINNPSAHTFEDYNKVIMGEAMALVRDNPDSTFLLLQKLVDYAKSLNLRDETSRALHAKGETYFMLGRYQNGLDDFNEAVTYNENREHLSRLFLRIGTSYQILGEQDSSRLYLNKGISIVEEIQDSAFFFRTHFIKGVMAFDDEQYITALDYFQKAEGYSDLAKNSAMIKGESLLMQARTYWVLDNKNQALAYALAGLKTLDEKKLISTSSVYRIYVAGYQMGVSDFTSAIANYQKALEYFKDKDRPNEKIQIFSGLAHAHIRTWNLKAAEEYLEKAKSLLGQVESEDIKLSYFMNNARLNIVKGNYQVARENLNTALNMAIRIGQDAERLSVLKIFIELEDAQNDLEGKLKFTERYHHLKDSLFSLMQSNLALDYESRYSKREQEKSIAELNMVNDVQSLKLEQQQKQIYWTSFLILGLLTLLYMAYRAYVNKKKNEQILNTKNLEISKALESNQLLLKEIHHRVKNNLQVVSSLLNLQSRQIEDAKAKEIIKSGQDRIKSMALIHQNLQQGEDMVGVSAKTYIQDLVGGLSRSYNLDSDKILVETSVDDISMEIDKIIPIGLILNELVSNALKYAFVEGQDGLIKVGLSKQENNILLSVEDNGKGLPRNFDLDKLKSLGFKIVRSFTNKLKGTIDFPTVNKGTKVLVTIPA